GEGVLGPGLRLAGPTALPGNQLASIVQLVHADSGRLVPQECQRGVAQVEIVDATHLAGGGGARGDRPARRRGRLAAGPTAHPRGRPDDPREDRKSTRLNSSHGSISY